MAEQQEIPYEQTELYRIRHSAAHIMAQAVTEMFPPGEAKVAIGPPIEDGFYYDFELPRQLTPEDFPAIEKRMRQIVAARHNLNAARCPPTKLKPNSRTSPTNSN